MSDGDRSGNEAAPTVSFAFDGRTVADSKPFAPEIMEGSRGADGNGVILPTAGYENPGATMQFRGVDANTGKMNEGGNASPPMIDIYTNLGDSIPAGDPTGSRMRPDSSSMNAGAEPNAADWRKTADSSDANWYPNPRPHSSFEDYGEQYPANGGVTDENIPGSI